MQVQNLTAFQHTLLNPATQTSKTNLTKPLFEFEDFNMLEDYYEDNLFRPENLGSNIRQNYLEEIIQDEQNALFDPNFFKQAEILQNIEEIQIFDENADARQNRRNVMNDFKYDITTTAKDHRFDMMSQIHQNQRNIDSSGVSNLQNTDFQNFDQNMQPSNNIQSNNQVSQAQNIHVYGNLQNTYNIGDHFNQEANNEEVKTEQTSKEDQVMINTSTQQKDLLDEDQFTVVFPILKTLIQVHEIKQIRSKKDILRNSVQKAVPCRKAIQQKENEEILLREILSKASQLLKNQRRCFSDLIYLKLFCKSLFQCEQILYKGIMIAPSAKPSICELVIHSEDFEKISSHDKRARITYSILIKLQTACDTTLKCSKNMKQTLSLLIFKFEKLFIENGPPQELINATFKFDPQQELLNNLPTCVNFVEFEKFMSKILKLIDLKISGNV
eukprot:403356845